MRTYNMRLPSEEGWWRTQRCLSYNEDLEGALHREHQPAFCCAFVSLQMDYDSQPSLPFL